MTPDRKESDTGIEIFLKDFENNNTKNRRTKNNDTINGELNLLDRLIITDVTNEHKLVNDLHYDNELRTNENTRKSSSGTLSEKPTPVTLVNIRDGKKGRNLRHQGLRVLLDSGTSHSIAGRNCAKKLKEKKGTFSTGNGALNTKYVSTIYFNLPEFSESKIITWDFHITEKNNLGYDMIIGRDLMQELGMDLVFSENVVTWEGTKIPMRDFKRLKKYKLKSKELNVIIQGSDEPIVTEEATNRMLKILDSTYKKADLKEVIKKAIHLSEKERKELYNLLVKYEDLFDGTLGTWKTDPVDFELKENEVPHSQRHYPVPHLYKATFKKELDRLVKLGVLETVQESEWGSPTFIVPKKDNKVRFVSDFRRLNAKLKRKPYPLPRIGDTLQGLEGFQYATSLDLNMGYYHIVLSETSSEMCTIVTEFGKYKYKRLPMGVSCSPDIFQAKIYELLGDIEGTKAYIDDILAIKKGSFKEHLEQLDEIFRRCQRVGLKINADKCRFGLNEIDYLGYIVTPTGIKPNPKKIEAIQNLERPKTVTEVRSLIGMVQYYRDLWPRRSHILEPFTRLSSGKKKTKIEWTDELQTSFEAIKKMVCRETLLTYPDWSKPFDIHTDASDYQLGAVISQEGKPIAFFSRKLNSAQKNYTTTEKELLSIVECVREFRNILFGYQIRVYSDHKNLVHAATVSQSQRVMRWRMILEEFGPDIKHISGEDNIVADAISRLPTADTDKNKLSTEAPYPLTKTVNEMEKLVLEDDGAFPLDLSLVRRTQQKEINKNNSELQKLLNINTSGYQLSTFEGIELVTYDNKIYVPKELRKRAMEWYHFFLCHPGADRLYNTMKEVCYWKGMAAQITRFNTTCDVCQKLKSRKRKYGHLPPKNVGELKPWKTVHVDLIGPYSLTAKELQPDGSSIRKEFSLTCMTFIDPVTGWFEIAQVPNYIIEDLKSKTLTESVDKTSARISQIFNQTWLSRYPRPTEVVFDNGSEFKKNFEPLLRDFSIKPKSTSIKNPQSNSPIERLHQVLKNMFTTKDMVHQTFDWIDPFGETLASVAWAVRASYNTATKTTPAQLVFGRDMIFNLKSLINWKNLSVEKKKLVDKANLRENQNRIDYDYSVGQRIYIKKDGIFRKLHGPKLGPYEITEVFSNGTVRIQRGHVNERINIRRLEPHFT